MWLLENLNYMCDISVAHITLFLHRAECCCRFFLFPLNQFCGVQSFQPEVMPFPRQVTPGLTPVVQQDLSLHSEQSHRVPLVVIRAIAHGALPT